MALGFPANHEETRHFSYRQEDLKSAVETVFESLEWRYASVSFFTYRASLSPNLLSWGESIVVEILPGGAVQAQSQCASPLQIFDWGKNRQNIQTFFDRLDRTIALRAETTAAEKRPLAFDEKGFSPVERIFEESNGA